jgi:hypothetical protein
VLVRSILASLPIRPHDAAQLPAFGFRLAGVRIDPAKLHAYRDVCGMRASDAVPLTYPQVLAARLQAALMADRLFPFRPMGAVHLGNRITAFRTLATTEVFDVTVSATNEQPHTRGRTFDMVTELRCEAELVWTGVATILSPGPGDPAARRTASRELVAGPPTTWSLGSDLGRRYATVSGDYNPIHLTRWSARTLGHPRALAHGMWSLARCVAAFEDQLPAEVIVVSSFKTPVFLPGRVNFRSRADDEGLHFTLSNPATGAPHLVGRAIRAS